MFKSSTKFIAIICTVIILLALAGWYWMFTIVRSNVEQANTLKSEAENKANLDSQNRALRKLLTSATDTVAHLQNRVIGSDDAVVYINQIENLAAQSGTGIIVNSVDIDQKASAPAGYEYLHLILSIQGTWQNVYTFISMIENLPYRVTINSVDMSQESFSDPAKKGKVESQWSGHIDFNTLKQK